MLDELLEPQPLFRSDVCSVFGIQELAVRRGVVAAPQTGPVEDDAVFVSSDDGTTSPPPGPVL